MVADTERGLPPAYHEIEPRFSWNKTKGAITKGYNEYGPKVAEFIGTLIAGAIALAVLIACLLAGILLIAWLGQQLAKLLNDMGIY
ncbi:hypothetical protein P152DRAFT_458905 [Eremomyces bilateralis CBS 781.70]|uniref:Uncharacterized protein n=1 Tax=Eremomyces bilateralis CBS 781.70 TaxID=1392243 RepID=A0A6G1G1N1_9PEZI|nr:uncharacterized protein P152DRAFT_458905 [Eremomyces bilateralis CBS 781.70]KAF1811953.1 hypothetical protein P152DRAFT_458905 [Eremomyces bilateralis CBS 781.70]